VVVSTRTEVALQNQWSPALTPDTALLNTMAGEEDREDLDDEKRKDSLKITWQHQPKKVLQSSLFDSVRVEPERKNPEVS